jgi:hypothetical protein
MFLAVKGEPLFVGSSGGSAPDSAGTGIAFLAQSSGVSSALDFAADHGYNHAYNGRT